MLCLIQRTAHSKLGNRRWVIYNNNRKRPLAKVWKHKIYISLAKMFTAYRKTQMNFLANPILETVAKNGRVITTPRSKGKGEGKVPRIRRKRESCKGGHHDRSNDFCREKQSSQATSPAQDCVSITVKLYMYIKSYQEQVWLSNKT